MQILYELLRPFKPRIGCAFCFNTLNPNDPDKSRRVFMKCTTCDDYYHQVCYERGSVCLHCGNNAVQAKVVSPVRLPAITLRPKRIRGHIDATGSTTSILNILQAILLMLFSFARWTLISAVFVVLITLISVYVYRLVTLTNPSAQSMLDAVLRTTAPSATVWWSALIAAILTGYTFFPSQLSDRFGTSAPIRYLTRFFGSGVTLILYNFLLFEIHLQDIPTFQPNRLQTEILIAEGSAIVLAFFAGFLRRAIYPIDLSRPVPNLARAFLNTIGIWRFYLVSGIVVLLAAILAVRELPNGMNRPLLTILPLPNATIAFTMPALVALTATFFCGLLIYLPPVHSPAQRKLWILRTIGLLLCIVVAVLTYQSTQNVDGFLNALLFAGIAALILLPLQRAIS